MTIHTYILPGIIYCVVLNNIVDPMLANTIPVCLMGFYIASGFAFTTMIDGVLLHCSCFVLTFWCPCMTINVSIQFNEGLLPDIILLT